MKNKIVIAFLTVLATVGVYTLSTNVDLSVNDAMATDTPQDLLTINGTCSASTVTGETPSVLTWITGATTVSSVGIPTYPAADVTVLTGGIGGGGVAAQGEADLAMSAVHHKSAGVTGIAEGRIFVRIEGPWQKIAGLQCTATQTAGFKIYGNDTSDDADMDVTTDGSNTADVTYTVGDKLDNLASGSALAVFGTSGTAQTGLVDDFVDATGEGDGEVVFGDDASPTTAEGAYQYEIDYDITRAAGTDTEALNIVFTY